MSKKEPKFQCAVCKKTVIVKDKEIIRICSHTSSGVIANLSAMVYGESLLKR